MNESDLNLWAPVVAAVGASLLTGIATFGIAYWQARRTEMNDLAGHRRHAYSRLLATSGIMIHSASTLRLTLDIRSGVSEGLDVVSGRRNPLDPFDLDEWIRKDLTPLYEAWSDVWTIGTANAVTAANKVVELAGEVVGQATTQGEGRGPITRLLLGEKWSQDQLDQWWGVVRRLAEARRDLGNVAREELDVEVADLFVEDEEQS